MHILFDIGATKTRIAVKKIHGDGFETPFVYETPVSYEDGVRMFKERSASLLNGEKPESIVGGIAGPWDKEAGTIKNSGNLTDWDDKPIVSDFSNEGTIPLYIDNDAAMAGLGEAHYGAGKNFHRVLYMTISSGVGGSIIENGEIAERLEPRHIVISEQGETLERVISGRGIEKKSGKKPKEIVDNVFWDHKAEMLAKGLSSILKDRFVDVVVLGGSIMSEIGISVEGTASHLQKFLLGQTPPVVHSTLGDFGGLYGALALIEKNSYNSAL